jgi:hypothetical protein
MCEKRRDWTWLSVVDGVHRVEQVSGIDRAIAKKRSQLVTPNGGVANGYSDFVFPAPFDDWAGLSIFRGDGNSFDASTGMLDVP